MIYTNVLSKNGQGVLSPFDGLIQKEAVCVCCLIQTV